MGFDVRSRYLKKNNKEDYSRLENMDLSIERDKERDRYMRMQAIELAKNNTASLPASESRMQLNQTNAGDNRTTAVRNNNRIPTMGLGTIFDPMKQGMNTAANGADVDPEKFKTEATTQNGYKGLIGNKSQEQTISKEQSLAHANEVYAPYKDNQEVTDLFNQYVDAADKLEADRMTGNSGYSKYREVRAKQKIEDQIKKITGLSSSDFKKVAENYTYLRHDEQRAEQQAELDEASGLKKAALTAGNIPTAAIGNYYAMLGALKKSNDPELGRDYNSTEFMLSNLSKDTKEAVHQDIDESTMKDYQKALAGFGYDAFTMGAESAASQMLGGAGLASFFAGGYASSLEEAEQRGLTRGQAQGYALVSGSLEYATEKIPWEGLKSIYAGKAIGKDAVKGSLIPYVKAFLKQAGEEAGEEVVNGLGDVLADALINSDKSKLNIAINNYIESGLSEEEATRKAILDEGKDILYAAASAAVSAGASAGPALAIQAYDNTKAGRNIANYENKTGNLTRNVENEAYIPNTREFYVADEDYENAQATRQAILNASEKAAKKERISGKEARALAESYSRTVEDINTARNVKAQQYFEGLKEQAENTAVEEVKNATTAVEVESIKEQFADSEKVIEAVEQKKSEMVAEGKATEQDFKEAITPLKAQEMAKKGEEIAPEQLEQLPKNVKDAYEVGYSQRANDITKEASKLDVTQIRVSDQGKSKVEKIKSVSKNKDGVLVFETSSGKTVTAADAIYSDKGKYFFEGDNGVLSLDEPALVQLAINTAASKPGISVGNLTQSLKNMYTLGATGVSFDAALKSSGVFENVVGRNALKAAYDEGAKKSAAKSRATAAKKGKGFISEVSEENREAYEKQFTSEEARKHYENEVTDVEKKFLSALSNKIGVDLELSYDTKTNDRGHYEPSEGKIYLNLAVGQNLFEVALHEGIGEFMAASNESAYNAIVDSVLNAYAATNSNQLAKNIQAYQRAYADDMYGDTARGASRELFNDAIGEIFSSEENIKKMFNWLVENEGVDQAEKVKKTLVDYLRDLVTLIKQIKANGGLSRLERQKLSLSEKQANDFADQILKAMDEAIANRDAGSVQQGESAARNSVEVLFDETKYVVPEKDIFIKEDGSEYSRIEAYKTILGKIVTHDGQEIRILKELKNVKKGEKDKDLCEELFKRRPGRYNGVADINAMQRFINGHFPELLYNSVTSKIHEPSAKDHTMYKIMDFDERIVNFLYTDNRIYTLKISIGNLKNGTQVAYGKRSLDYNEELTKIMESPRAGESHQIATPKNSLSPFEEKTTTNTAPKSINVEKLNDTVRHSFAGINSATADKEQLKIAQELQKKGMSDLTILESTGWFLGMDNQWKYEIPDNDIEIFKEGNREYVKNNPDFARYLELENKILFTDSEYTEEEYDELLKLDEIVSSDEYYKTKRYGKLSDYIQHDELFRSYPWMQNVDVMFVPMESDKEKGYADPQDLIIALNIKFQTNAGWNKDALKSTLLHEIQHIIQAQEGFAGGSTPEWWANIRDERIERDKKNIEGAKEHLKKWVDKAAENGNPTSTGEFVTQSVHRVADKNDSYDMEDHWAAVAEWKATSSIYYYESMISKLERHIDRLLSESDIELYYNTAGEIEARDTANRANWTKEQRLKTFPVQNAKDVVYPKENITNRRYSIKVDNQGRNIATGMQQYLKDNADVFYDENGAVKNYYHGSSVAGFTEFDPTLADDGISMFFTDNKTVAKTYNGSMTMFEPDKEWTFNELKDHVYWMSDRNADAYEEDGKIEIEDFADDTIKTFDTVKEAQDYWVNEYLTDSDHDFERVGIYNVYLKSSNPLIVEANNRNWDELEDEDKVLQTIYNVEFIDKTDDGKYKVNETVGLLEYWQVYTYEQMVERYGKHNAEQLAAGRDIDNVKIDENGKHLNQTTRDWANYAKENGYDSVVFNNLIDSGLYGSTSEQMTPSQVVVIFSPSQAKSVYNQNPTAGDADIRKSIKVDWDKNDITIPARTYDAEKFFDMSDEEMAAAEQEDIKVKAYWANIIHSKDFAGLMFSWPETRSNGQTTTEQRYLTRSTREYDWQYSYGRDNEPHGHYNYYEKNDDVTAYGNPWGDDMAALYQELLGDTPMDGIKVHVLREGVAEDARYSKAVFGEESPYNDALQQAAVIENVLSTINNQLKGQTVSLPLLNKTVDTIIRKYKSNISAEDLQMELAQFIAYMTKTEQVDYNQMMNYLLNVGDEVIKSSQLKDPEQERVYNELKKELSSHKINLTENERKELISRYGGSWNTVFGKLNAVGIKLNNAGVHMDGSTYSEIADKFLEIAGVSLDQEITAVDQIATIIDAMEVLEPSAYQWDGATSFDKAMDVAVTIIDSYYSMAASIKEANIAKGTEKGQKAINKAVKQETAKLRAKNEEYKAKLNEEFQQLVEDRKKVMQEQQDFLKRQAEAEKQFRGEKRAFDRRVNMSAKELEKTARLQAQMQYQGIRDTEAKRKHKDNIVRTSMRLINWMNKPTDTRHVPTFLKPALTDLIKSINFMPASMRRGEDGTISAMKWQESMRKLQQVIQGLSNVDAETLNDSDKYELSIVMEIDEIVNKMQQLLDKNGGTADVSRMSKEDLKTLSDIMKSISEGISHMNENFMNRRFKHVSDAAVAAMNEMSDLKPVSNTLGKVKDTAADFLNLDMAEPITFFEELGNASESIMQEFFDGEKIGIDIIKEADNFFQDLGNRLGLTTKEIRSWENDAKDYRIGGVNITLTSADIMSLYCSYHRELLDQQERPFEATHHIMSGGIKGFRHTISNGFKIKEVNRNPQVAHANEGQIMDLINSLSETQKNYADAVVEYMSTTLAAHGNETSNKLNGYSKFLGKYYFPLKTDNNAIATTESNNTSDQAAFRRLIFPSFTKSQVDKADNALVLMNFFDVVTEHITGMSNYCAYAMPISDAMRWYNYAETERNNTEVENLYLRDTRSVKGSMDKVRGDGARKYFENFIRDVNLDNKPMGSKASKLISQGLTGLAKAKAVGLNIRVIVQQPCAIIRAADVIEGKYLAEGWAKMSKNPAEATRYAKDKSYLCYWKSKGFSDTRVSQSMKEIITGNASLRQDIVEKTGILAGLADDISWASMYYAAENKIKDTTDFKEGSEEFNKAVEELFSDIINHTQVIDSNLRKTGTMRSQDAIEKLANAFKKEPQKTYNMLHRAYWNKIQAEYQGDANLIADANRKWKKALTVFVENAFVTAIAQSLVDAWRDDEDENYFIKILKKMLPYDSFAAIKDMAEKLTEGKAKPKDVLGLIQGIYGGAGNILDNANIASSIPYVADIDSMLKGYSVTRLDSTSILTQLKNTVNALGASTATPYSMIYSIAQLVGYATGIGADNALKDLRGIYNQAIGNKTGLRIEKNATAAKKNAKTRETNRISDVFDTNDLSSMKTEVQSVYQQKIDEGKDESAAWKASRDMLKEQYQRMIEEHPEEKAAITNRFKTLLKYTKKSNGKGGYRAYSDKEVNNTIENWNN